MSRRVRREFPGASAYYDRHGKRRWRFRRKGFSAELGSDYGSPDFVRRYEDAVAGLRSGPGAGAGKTIPKSISDLIARYYRSAAYLGLKPSTKNTYRGILERFREEHGTKSAIGLKRRHIQTILAEKIETPSAGNNLLDRLRALMDLAVDLDWRLDNPANNVKRLKERSGGFHTWSEAEIEKFYAVHKPGSVAHTAMTLMLYTGAARSDAVKLGRGNVHGDRLRYRRQKTENSGGVLIDIPIHHQLRAVMNNCPSGAFTFLQTKYGRGRSPNGLGNQMRTWCDKAGLPECTSHGLRKAIARRLAEAGATPHEIMAVTGHKTLAEVDRYTKDVNRPTLATDGITRLK